MSFGKRSGVQTKQCSSVRFNPCSNGCRSGSSAAPPPPEPGGAVVSILVLMDVVREASGADRVSVVPWGFNPCSNECRSGRFRRVIARKNGTGFNPCSNGCRSGSGRAEV